MMKEQNQRDVSVVMEKMLNGDWENVCPALHIVPNAYGGGGP